MITCPLTEDQQRSADIVSAVFVGLENGTAPEDWIEQLHNAGVGSYCEQWGFAIRLGVKGCEASYKSKAIWLRGTPVYLIEKGLELLPPRKGTLRFQLDTESAYKSDSVIIDCLLTSARIAYVQGFDKAMEMCIKAMSNQKLYETTYHSRFWRKQHERADSMWRELYTESRYQGRSQSYLCK